MALDQDQVVLPAIGHLFVAPTDTAAPTLSDLDLTTGQFSTAVEWENLGHTARGELPEFGFDGGEREPKGTWQKEVLRYVSSEVPADYLIANVHQFTNTTLGLYYGGTGGSTAGQFEITGSSGDQSKSLLVVIVDGNNRIGFHAPNTTAAREDSVELDVEEFAFLPLRFSIASAVDGGTVAYKMAWIADGLGPVA